MSLNRIFAIFVYHTQVLLHEKSRFVRLAVGLILDVLVWGIFWQWMMKTQNFSMHIQMTFLVAVLLNQVFSRTCLELGFSLLEELWGNTLVNLAASPLKPIEWILGVLSFALPFAVGLMIFGMIFFVLFFNFPVINLLNVFLLFGFPIILSGMSIGLLVLCPIIYFGRKIQDMAFMVIALVGPFNAVIYPKSILPLWAQKLSSILPTSYIFEGIRAYRLQNQSPFLYILKSCSISLLYIGLFILLFLYMFKKSKEKGLARLSE